jgi:hypothetical protein
MNAPFPHPDLPIPLWNDIRLFDYLGAMNERHNTVDYIAMPNLRDTPRIRLNKIFVNPLLAPTPASPATDPKEWPQGIGLYDALEQSRALVVLGDPGCGKTTLANWLAWRLSISPGYPLPPFLEERVPICCVLREMKSEMFAPHITIPDLLDWNIRSLLGKEPNERSVGSLHNWVKAKRYVLILDGIDEIALSHRATVAQWMKQVVADGAFVLATSRIVGYDDYPIDQVPQAISGEEGLRNDDLLMARLGQIGQFKRERLLPELCPENHGKPGATENYGEESAPENANPPWATCLYLLPFDDQRIRTFIHCWYGQRGGGGQRIEDRVADLWQAIKASNDILELARTPNLLGLMAIVHRERAHLPNGRALLYKEIANAYINTIDQQRQINPDDILVRYPVEVREIWIAYIGFQMQKRRSNARGKEQNGILVSKVDVLAWLETAMGNSNMPNAEQHAKEFLDWVARRSGLLLPRGEEWYAFAHLSFQEYFCARFLMAQVTSPAYIRGTTNKTLLIAKQDLAHWADMSHWRETLIYLLELISSERGADWLQELLVDIFGEVDEEKDFHWPKANLAYKIINNQHIYLDATRKRGLALNSVYLCAGSDESIFDEFCKAGYAIRAAQDKMPSTTQLSLPANIDPANVFAFRLANPEVQDITVLAKLGQLRVLTIVGTQTDDLTPLKDLTKLRYLYAYNQKIKELAPIKGLHRLETLLLQNTDIKDITPLANLKRLRLICLYDCPITDFTPLLTLDNLQTILLSEAQESAAASLATQRPNLKITYI